MEILFTQFASETASSTDIPSALGINWTILIFQIIAFSILMWALGKWVYPVFIRIIDKRQAMIEESTHAAVQAEKNAAKTQLEVGKLLSQARSEAREIVATAKDEATSMLADAEAKTKTQADHIMTAAQESIAKEVLLAKKALHNEMVELVALATQKVVGKSVSDSVDDKLISAALEESK